MATDADEDARFSLVAERRRTLAAYLRALPEDRWRAPSLCGGWSVREVAGHLVTPLLQSAPRLGWEVVRCGGSVDRALDRLARRYALLPTADLVDVLDEHADDRFTPPGFGAIAPLTDSVIHTLDVRWSLEDREPIPPPAARAVLQFLTTPKAKAFGARGVVPGVRWEANDLDWSAGDHGDPRVSGPTDALLLVLAGRRAGLDALSGPGAAVVTQRLAR